MRKKREKLLSLPFRCLKKYIVFSGNHCQGNQSVRRGVGSPRVGSPGIGWPRAGSLRGRFAEGSVRRGSVRPRVGSAKSRFVQGVVGSAQVHAQQNVICVRAVLRARLACVRGVLRTRPAKGYLRSHCPSHTPCKMLSAFVLSFAHALQKVICVRAVLLTRPAKGYLRSC